MTMHSGLRENVKQNKITTSRKLNSLKNKPRKKNKDKNKTMTTNDIHYGPMFWNETQILAGICLKRPGVPLEASPVSSRTTSASTMCTFNDSSLREKNGINFRST